MLLRPDPTFYSSARMAMQARPEWLAFLSTFNANGQIRLEGGDSSSDSYC